MTTQEKLIRNKQSLIELAEFLKNVSQACKIHGVPRQHFYDIKQAYEEHGLEGQLVLVMLDLLQQCSFFPEPLIIPDFVVLTLRMHRHLSKTGTLISEFILKRIA